MVLFLRWFVSVMGRPVTYPAPVGIATQLVHPYQQTYRPGVLSRNSKQLLVVICRRVICRAAKTAVSGNMQSPELQAFPYLAGASFWNSSGIPLCTCSSRPSKAWEFSITACQSAQASTASSGLLMKTQLSFSPSVFFLSFWCFYKVCLTGEQAGLNACSVGLTALGCCASWALGLLCCTVCSPGSQPPWPPSGIRGLTFASSPLCQWTVLLAFSRSFRTKE